MKGGAIFQDARKTAVSEKNASLQKRVHALETILEAGLARNAQVAVGDWKPEPTIADLPAELRELHRPDPDRYAAPPLGILERVIPGAVARHAEARGAAEVRLQAAVGEWEAQQSRQTQALAALVADVARHNQQLDETEARLRSGDGPTVKWYVERVLEMSPYPKGLRRGIAVKFNVAPNTIRVNIGLAGADEVVPGVLAYRFAKQRDEVIESQWSPEDRAALYRSIVAQTALRTLHEVFSAELGGCIDVVALWLDEIAVDPATGKDKVERLARVKVDRGAFREIDLARIDPVPCFKNLKKLSREAAAAAAGDG